MPLDIHLGAEEADASRAPRLASIELKTHERIFKYIGGSRAKWPLLFRLSDCCNDARYELHDLHDFSRELRLLLDELPDDFDAVETIKALIGAVNEAQRSQRCLWAFCD